MPHVIANALKRRPVQFALLLAVPATAFAAIYAMPAMRDDAGGTPAALAAPRPTMLGVNVGGVSYFSGDRALMNLAQGAAWGIRPKGAGGGQPLDPARADEFGMPKSLQPGETAVKMLVPPEGAYYGSRPVRVRCTWQGKGELQAGLYAARPSYGKASAEFDWPPANAEKANPVWLVLQKTDPADPLRRIDCREKGASPTALFAPPFLDLLAGYKVLRFMDWQNVNANAPVTWATRIRPESEDQTDTGGVAIEYMVALANEMGADAWFTIPWNADEDYVRRFATYARDHLAPGRKAYVEVGNEVWNWGFRVTHQARDEGLAEGLSDDGNDALWRRYAERSTQVFAIWSDVFQANPDRLIRVMGFQNGNVRSMQQALDFRDTAQHVDAVASAPYFGYALFAGDRAKMTDLNAIFAYLDGDVDKTLEQAAALKAAAAKYGKRYIAYEGGQHVLNADNVALLTQINRDPRMYDLYRKYLSRWQRQIGDTLALYASHGGISRFGAWGLREYPGQPLDQTPKRRAVVEFLRAAPQAAAPAAASPAPHR